MVSHRTIEDYEQGIFKYLDQEGVHPSDVTLQRIVVGNFYDQRHGDNDDVWNEKIAYTVLHFIDFQQHVKEDWAKQ